MFTLKFSGIIKLSSKNFKVGAVMSVKACIGSMMVGIAVGAAVCTFFPMPVSHRSVRQVRRYIRNML